MFIMCQNGSMICWNVLILLVKMLRIFPTGVTSKKMLTGALRTYLKVSWWTCLVMSFFILWKAKSRTFPKTKPNKPTYVRVCMYSEKRLCCSSGANSVQYIVTRS